MKKLVLGIAVVLVLDVAFIWMMGNKAKPLEMAQARIPISEEPAARERPSVETVATNVGEEPDDRDIVSSAPSGRSEPNSISNPVTYRVPKAKTVEIRTPSLDGKQLFPDKIIYYGKYEAPETSEPSLEISRVKIPATPEVVAAKPPLESEKRSFRSRAFGVIKKPFNVIKKPFKWIGNVATDIVH